MEVYELTFMRKHSVEITGHEVTTLFRLILSRST